jgi:hypothetical protein
VGGPNSKLWVIQLTTDGLTTIGSPEVLLEWSQAVQIENLDTSSLGTTPCLENPQLVLDPYNTYDLMFSIGTWISNRTYFTGEVGCPALNYTASGCGIDPEDGSVFTTDTGGGASTWTTGLNFPL